MPHAADPFRSSSVFHLEYFRGGNHVPIVGDNDRDLGNNGGRDGLSNELHAFRQSENGPLATEEGPSHDFHWDRRSRAGASR